MALDVILSVWPVLLGLAYVLVTCTLSVLASHRRHMIDMHDRVRRSKQLRSDYLHAVEEKRALAR